MSSELEDILAAFSRLVEEHEASRGGASEDDPENFRCTDCVDCVACRFCTSCERCSNCTYCDACSDCADCTQSRECIACADCSQSNLSAYCERSSYLTLCLDCEGCVQCFGCVGLTDAEFHILNQPYKRSVYFKKVAELRKLLDVKLTEGWQPPWATEGEPSEYQAEPEVEAAAVYEAESDVEEAAYEAESGAEEASYEAESDVEAAPEGTEVEVAPEDPEVDAASQGADEVEPAPKVRIEPEITGTVDPHTEVATPGAPRRIDPYTDRTARLADPGTGMEHSWPPADTESARSMDRASESWEDLFEPDELPPPRSRPEPPAAEPTPATASEPKPASPRPQPKPGRFERLIAETTGAAPAKQKPSEPPASFLGQVPAPPAEPTPARGSSLRRAKRPRRD